MGKIEIEQHPNFQWLRFEADRTHTGGIAFYGIVKDPYNGIKAKVTNLYLEEYDESHAPVWHHPAFWMTKENSQQLMDDLWNCGIRPTDMGDAAGALPATERHLADLQKVFYKHVLGDE